MPVYLKNWTVIRGILWGDEMLVVSSLLAGPRQEVVG